MLKLLVLSLSFTTVVYSLDGPILTLPNGQIQGVKATTSRNNITFYAFMGIPYAAPPVGNLRFMAPQPVKSWNGTLKTQSNKKVCYQTAMEHANDAEDCLYISVYTPVEPGTASDLPIMINIHGGTFIRGTGFTSVNTAQYVLESNVIVASINYRLGVFGFLSTLDDVIPGNYGIKDQQLALKWLQENIQYFGGDPKKVTVMGQSAGSASVTYQLLAAGSKGLFRAAIAQSGSALNTWAHQRHPVETAYGIAAEIDPTFDPKKSTQELLEFLQSADVKAIHNATYKYKIYSPVIEVEHDTAMITESMYQAVENGRVNKVPVLMGICSEEALNSASSISKSAKKYDQDPSTLVDEDMGITDENTLRIVGENVEENVGKAIQYYGDNRYMRAVIKYAELQAQFSDLYFYQFSYHGVMGDNSESYEGIGKVMHAEDLNYFWASSYPTLEGLPENDIRTMDRYIGLLTNFAKELNPTPNQSEIFQDILWPKVTSDHYYYLDIDTNLTIQENPRNFSYGKWTQLFDEYAAKPLISF